MSLRTKFFALTYDRQIAGAEKAGLRAFREALLAGFTVDPGGAHGAAEGPEVRCRPAVVGHAAAPGYPSPAAGSGSQLTGRAG